MNIVAKFLKVYSSQVLSQLSKASQKTLSLKSILGAKKPTKRIATFEIDIPNSKHNI